jgi:photosystem II stability/assembly factor-like uncharacterized protein
MVSHPVPCTFVVDMLHFKVGYQRRSLTLIGLSLSVLAVAAAAYFLVPGVLHLSGQPQAPSPTPQWQLLSASFDGVDHGAVTMVRTTGLGQLTINPPSSVATYLTSDGARTWKRLRYGVAFTSFLERDYAVISYLDRRSFDITADGGRTWTSVAWPEVPAVGKVRVGSAGGTWGLGRFEGPVFLGRANVWWLTAGQGPAPGPVALWRSSDGTRTWTHVGAIGVPNDQLVGVPTFIDQLRGAMVVVPTSTLDAWPSLVTTRDGGETWQPATLPEPLVAGVHLAVPDPQAAVLVAHGGRLVLSLNMRPANVPAGFGPPGDARNRPIVHWSSLSEDGGQTWTPWAIEPATNFVASGAITFDDKDHLLLADDRRLWTSNNYGRTWQGRSLPLPMNVHAVDLLAAQADGLVMAGWRGPRIPAELVLLRSRDGGAHWSEVPLPRPEQSPDGG